jgi:hypothetical protein
LSDQRRLAYLNDVLTPVRRDDMIEQLQMLAIVAEDTINTDPMREEAEKLLLRYINNPDVSEAFYNVRRFCS